MHLVKNLHQIEDPGRGSPQKAKIEPCLRLIVQLCPTVTAEPSLATPNVTVSLIIRKGM